MGIERIFKRALASTLRAVVTPGPGTPASEQQPANILVVRQHNQLGDMLCVVPLLRALRARYPEARVALMASPVNADVMRGNRYLDEVILFDKREFLSGRRLNIGALRAFGRTLNSRAFNLTLVPSTVSTSFTSDLLAYLSGAPVRVGVASLDGKENPSAFLFTKAEPLDWRKDPHRHQTLRNLDLARSLNLAETGLECEITLTKSEKIAAATWINERFPASKGFLAFHPGAGKVPNRWPADRFAAVAEQLSTEFNLPIVVTSGPMDEEPLKWMEATLCRNAYVIKNEPIRRVASILSYASLVITNDTGIMHVAAAVGSRVLSLFGPTDPGQWAPHGIQNRFIKGEGGEIGKISTDVVLQNAREMLSR